MALKEHLAVVFYSWTSDLGKGDSRVCMKASSASKHQQEPGVGRLYVDLSWHQVPLKMNHQILPLTIARLNPWAASVMFTGAVLAPGPFPPNAGIPSDPLVTGQTVSGLLSPHGIHSGRGGTSLLNTRHLQTALGHESEESCENLHIHSSRSLKEQVCCDGSHRRTSADTSIMCHPTPQGWTWRLWHQAMGGD